ncbi:MAG: HNH endonuclease [Armatimonadetes bacterium]|nr:HNH endonuclease [Armatimonadota bacterium]
MRPVDKGVAPTTYSAYEEAKPDLVSRLGTYCSYCERRLATHIAVEHIINKDRDPSLRLVWDNFLLTCVNCNSAKGTKIVSLDTLYFPDRDNTFFAFEYLADANIVPSSSLTPAQAIIATDTRALTELNRPIRTFYDANGKRVAIEKISQRMDVWASAKRSRDNLSRCCTDAMRDQIVISALAEGFFSIWMTVFEGDAEMRNRFITEFTGTAKDCFDPITTAPISPRSKNHLAHSGKI